MVRIAHDAAFVFISVGRDGTDGRDGIPGINGIPGGQGLPGKYSFAYTSLPTSVKIFDDILTTLCCISCYSVGQSKTKR